MAKRQDLIDLEAKRAKRVVETRDFNNTDIVAHRGLPEWYDDAVRLAQSGRRFYHIPSCAVQGAVIDGCTCGAASANAVLDRMAAT